MGDDARAWLNLGTKSSIGATSGDKSSDKQSEESDEDVCKVMITGIMQSQPTWQVKRTLD